MSINRKYVMAGMLATALVAPMANATESHAEETRITTANVNFRTGPSTSYSSMGVIKKGQSVTYLETNGDWIKASYNSKTGYIYKSYVSTSTSSETTSNETSTSPSVRYVKASPSLNVRTGPSTSYARITSLANGTQVTVIATSGEWSKITCGNVTGYVSSLYLTSTNNTNTSTNNESNNQSNNETAQEAVTKYVNASSLNVRTGPSTSYSKVTSLSKGTKLTVVATNGGWSKITSGSVTGYVDSSYLTSTQPSTSNGTSSSTNSSSVSKVLNYAKALLGKPYVWGAQGPNGFDCSGFTYYVFKNSAGITLPRTASAQSKFGTYVSKSNLQPGDLVFFDTVGANNGVVTHCGIYLGNGQLIHSASGQGRVVINNFNTSYYAKAYVTARRVL